MKDMAASATGVAIGSAGLKYAEFLPILLQYGNLLLIAVSVIVGVLTIIEKSRKISSDQDNTRIQRKLLRRMGVDPDSDTREGGL
jgi:hypothetical protein